MCNVLLQFDPTVEVSDTRNDDQSDIVGNKKLITKKEAALFRQPLDVLFVTVLLE